MEPSRVRGEIGAWTMRTAAALAALAASSKAEAMGPARFIIIDRMKVFAPTIQG